MTRVKDLDVDDLTEEQLLVYKKILEGPRGNVVGPLKIWLNNPKFASCAQVLGKYARYESNLPSSLSELAIITTGRCWSSDFEWEQHAPLANKAGIKIEYINQISKGKRPTFSDEIEQVVFDFSAEVNLNKNVSEKIYTKAVKFLGENGVLDIVAICGYYNLVSMTLNVYKVPPEGSKWILPKVANLDGMLLK